MNIYIVGTLVGLGTAIVFSALGFYAHVLKSRRRISAEDYKKKYDDL